MELEKMTLADLTKLMGLFSKKKKEPSVLDGGVRIVILQRGWVAVGRYSRKGSQCKLEQAYIIRKWGTTQGLPEIAIKGPLADTILDKSPNIEFHQLTEIANIECAEDKWLSRCPR